MLHLSVTRACIREVLSLYYIRHQPQGELRRVTGVAGVKDLFGGLPVGTCTKKLRGPDQKSKKHAF